MKRRFPWSIIIIAFIIFWPVGLVLLLMNKQVPDPRNTRPVYINQPKNTVIMQQGAVNQAQTIQQATVARRYVMPVQHNQLCPDLKKYHKRVKHAKNWVIGLGIGAGLFWLIAFDPFDFTYLFWAVGLTVGAVVMFRRHKKLQVTNLRYKRYIKLVTTQDCSLLSDISAQTGIHPKIVREDLDMMLQVGFFEGAYIDESTQEIVLAGRLSQATKERRIHSEEREAASHAQWVARRCSSCGGTTRVQVGKVAVCEYCDSAL